MAAYSSPTRDTQTNLRGWFGPVAASSPIGIEVIGSVAVFALIRKFRHEFKFITHELGHAAMAILSGAKNVRITKEGCHFDLVKSNSFINILVIFGGSLANIMTAGLFGTLFMNAYKDNFIFTLASFGYLSFISLVAAAENLWPDETPKGKSDGLVIKEEILYFKGIMELEKIADEAAVKREKSSSPIERASKISRIREVTNKKEIINILENWIYGGTRKCLLGNPVMGEQEFWRKDIKKAKWGSVILHYVGRPERPVAILLAFRVKEFSSKWIYIDTIERDESLSGQEYGWILLQNFVEQYGKFEDLAGEPDYRPGEDETPGAYDEWIAKAERLGFMRDKVGRTYYRPADVNDDAPADKNIVKKAFSNLRAWRKKKTSSSPVTKDDESGLASEKWPYEFPVTDFSKLILESGKSSIIVCDLGSGSKLEWGRVLVEAYPQIKYLGVDYSDWYVDAFQRTMKKWLGYGKYKNVKFRRQSFFDPVPKKWGKADIVTLHSPHASKEFLRKVSKGDLNEAIRRNLKPGGLAFLLIDWIGYGYDREGYELLTVAQKARGIHLKALRNEFGVENVLEMTECPKGYFDHLLDVTKTFKLTRNIVKERRKDEICYRMSFIQVRNASSPVKKKPDVKRSKDELSPQGRKVFEWLDLAEEHLERAKRKYAQTKKAVNKLSAGLLKEEMSLEEEIHGFLDEVNPHVHHVLQAMNRLYPVVCSDAAEMLKALVEARFAGRVCIEIHYHHAFDHFYCIVIDIEQDRYFYASFVDGQLDEEFRAMIAALPDESNYSRAFRKRRLDYVVFRPAVREDFRIEVKSFGAESLLAQLPEEYRPENLKESQGSSSPASSPVGKKTLIGILSAGQVIASVIGNISQEEGNASAYEPKAEVQLPQPKAQRFISNFAPIRINLDTIKYKTAVGAKEVTLHGKKYKLLFNYEEGKVFHTLVMFRISSGEELFYKRVTYDELIKGISWVAGDYVYRIQQLDQHITFVPVDEIFAFNKKLEEKTQTVPVDDVIACGREGFTITVENEDIIFRYRQEEAGDKIDIAIGDMKMPLPFVDLLSGAIDVYLDIAGRAYMVTGDGHGFKVVPHYMVAELVKEKTSVAVEHLWEVTRASGEEFILHGRKYLVRYQEETIRRGKRRGIIPSFVIRDTETGDEASIPNFLLINGCYVMLDGRKYIVEFDENGQDLIIKPAAEGWHVHYDQQQQVAKAETNQTGSPVKLRDELNVKRETIRDAKYVSRNTNIEKDRTSSPLETSSESLATIILTENKDVVAYPNYYNPSRIDVVALSKKLNDLAWITGKDTRRYSLRAEVDNGQIDVSIGAGQESVEQPGKAQFSFTFRDGLNFIGYWVYMQSLRDKGVYSRLLETLEAPANTVFYASLAEPRTLRALQRLRQNRILWVLSRKEASRILFPHIYAKAGFNHQIIQYKEKQSFRFRHTARKAYVSEEEVENFIEALRGITLERQTTINHLMIEICCFAEEPASLVQRRGINLQVSLTAFHSVALLARAAYEMLNLSQESEISKSSSPVDKYRVIDQVALGMERQLWQVLQERAFIWRVTNIEQWFTMLKENGFEEKNTAFVLHDAYRNGKNIIHIYDLFFGPPVLAHEFVHVQQNYNNHQGDGFYELLQLMKADEQAGSLLETLGILLGIIAQHHSENMVRMAREFFAYLYSALIFPSWVREEEMTRQVTKQEISAFEIDHNRSLTIGETIKSLTLYLIDSLKESKPIQEAIIKHYQSLGLPISPVVFTPTWRERNGWGVRGEVYRDAQWLASSPISKRRQVEYQLPSSGEIRGIIYDLDGTLWKNFWLTKEYIKALTEVVSERHGISKWEAFRLIRGMRELLKEENGRKVTAIDMIEAFDVKPQAWIKKTKQKIKTRKYLNRDKRMNDVLFELSLFFKQGLLTNSSETMAKRITTDLGVKDYFVSATVACLGVYDAKPAKGPFLETARLMEVSPRYIISVGDDWRTDIEPAIDLGMGYIWVRGPKDIYRLPQIIEEMTSSSPVYKRQAMEELLDGRIVQFLTQMTEEGSLGFKFKDSPSMLTITHVDRGDAELAFPPEIHDVMYESIYKFYQDTDLIDQRMILRLKNSGSSFTGLHSLPEFKGTIIEGKNLFDYDSLAGSLNAEAEEKVLEAGDVFIVTGTSVEICLKETFRRIFLLKNRQERRTIIFVTKDATNHAFASDDESARELEKFAAFLNVNLIRGDYDVYDFAEEDVLNLSSQIPQTILIWMRSSEEVLYWLERIKEHKKRLGFEGSSSPVGLRKASFVKGEALEGERDTRYEIRDTNIGKDQSSSPVTRSRKGVLYPYALLDEGPGRRGTFGLLKGDIAEDLCDRFVNGLCGDCITILSFGGVRSLERESMPEAHRAVMAVLEHNRRYPERWHGIKLTRKNFKVVVVSEDEDALKTAMKGCYKPRVFGRIKRSKLNRNIGKETKDLIDRYFDVYWEETPEGIPEKIYKVKKEVSQFIEKRCSRLADFTPEEGEKYDLIIYNYVEFLIEGQKEEEGVAETTVLIANRMLQWFKEEGLLLTTAAKWFATFPEMASVTASKSYFLEKGVKTVPLYLKRYLPFPNTEEEFDQRLSHVIRKLSARLGMMGIHIELNTELIETAWRWAKEIHLGQYRKWGGSALNHIFGTLRVLLYRQNVIRFLVKRASLPLHVYITSTLLHDILEDAPPSDVTGVRQRLHRDLVKAAGEKEAAQIMMIIDLLTKRKDEDDEQYLERIFWGSDAISLAAQIVKVVDRIHNFSNPSPDKDSQKHYEKVMHTARYIENSKLPKVIKRIYKQLMEAYYTPEMKKLRKSKKQNVNKSKVPPDKSSSPVKLTLHELEEQQRQTLRDFNVRKVEPNLSKVESVRVIRRFPREGSKLKKTVYKKDRFARMLGIVACVPHALNFLSDVGEGIQFNKNRAGQAMTRSIYRFFKRFFWQMKGYRGRVILAEEQRYGIEGTLVTGEKFGSGDQVLRIGLDQLEGSAHIDRRNKGPLLNVFLLGERSTLYGGPDSLYFLKILIGKTKQRVRVSLYDKPAIIAQKITKAFGIEVTELKIAILERPRHAGFVKELRAAGVQVRLIGAGELGLLEGLLTGELHAVLGIGRPNEAEIMMHFARKTGMQFFGRLASYEAFKNCGNLAYEESLTRVEQFTDKEKGDMRKKNLIHPGIVRKGQWPWDKIWTEKDGSENLAMVFTYINDSIFDEEIKGVNIDEEDVITLHSLYLDIFNEAKVFESKLKTMIPALKERIENTESHEKKAAHNRKLARCYARFGLYDEALKAINKGILFSGVTPKTNQFESIRLEILAYKHLVREEPERALSDGILSLKDAIDRWDGNIRAKKLLRRLYNHLGDTKRIQARNLMKKEKRTSEALDEIIEAFIEAKIYYENAFKYFLLPKQRNKWDDLDYELVEKQIQEVSLMLEILREPKKQQDFYYDLGYVYKAIAELYRERHYNQRAVVYFRRAIEAWKQVQRFGGLVPLEVQWKSALSYEEAGMAELAAREFWRLIHPQQAFNVAYSQEAIRGVSNKERKEMREGFTKKRFNKKSLEYGKYFNEALKGFVFNQMTFANKPDSEIEERLDYIQDALDRGVEFDVVKKDGMWVVEDNNGEMLTRQLIDVSSSPVMNEEQMIQEFVGAIRYAREIGCGNCIPHSVALQFSLWLRDIDSQLPKLTVIARPSGRSNLKCRRDCRVASLLAMTCYFISQTSIIVGICNLNLDIYDEDYTMSFDRHMRSQDHSGQIRKKWDEFVKLKIREVQVLRALQNTKETSSPVATISLESGISRDVSAILRLHTQKKQDSDVADSGEIRAGPEGDRQSSSSARPQYIPEPSKVGTAPTYWIHILHFIFRMSLKEVGAVPTFAALLHTLRTTHYAQRNTLHAIRNLLRVAISTFDNFNNRLQLLDYSSLMQIVLSTSTVAGVVHRKLFAAYSMTSPLQELHVSAADLWSKIRTSYIAHRTSISHMDNSKYAAKQHPEGEVLSTKYENASSPVKKSRNGKTKKTIADKIRRKKYGRFLEELVDQSPKAELRSLFENLTSWIQIVPRTSGWVTVARVKGRNIGMRLESLKGKRLRFTPLWIGSNLYIMIEPVSKMIPQFTEFRIFNIKSSTGFIESHPYKDFIVERLVRGYINEPILVFSRNLPALRIKVPIHGYVSLGTADSTTFKVWLGPFIDQVVEITPVLLGIDFYLKIVSIDEISKGYTEFRTLDLRNSIGFRTATKAEEEINKRTSSSPVRGTQKLDLRGVIASSPIAEEVVSVKDRYGERFIVKSAQEGEQRYFFLYHIDGSKEILVGNLNYSVRDGFISVVRRSGMVGAEPKRIAMMRGFSKPKEKGEYRERGHWQEKPMRIWNGFDDRRGLGSLLLWLAKARAKYVDRADVFAISEACQEFEMYVRAADFTYEGHGHLRLDLNNEKYFGALTEVSEKRKLTILKISADWLSRDNKASSPLNESSDGLEIPEWLRRRVESNSSQGQAIRSALDEILNHPQEGLLQGNPHLRLMSKTGKIYAYVFKPDHVMSIFYVVYPNGKIKILDIVAGRTHKQTKKKSWIRKMRALLKKYDEEEALPPAPVAHNAVQLFELYAAGNSDVRMVFDRKRPFLVLRSSISQVQEVLADRKRQWERVVFKDGRTDEVYAIIDKNGVRGRFGKTRDGDIAFSPHRINSLSDGLFIVRLVKDVLKKSAQSAQDGASSSPIGLRETTFVKRETPVREASFVNRKVQKAINQDLVSGIQHPVRPVILRSGSDEESQIEILPLRSAQGQDDGSENREARRDTRYLPRRQAGASRDTIIGRDQSSSPVKDPQEIHLQDGTSKNVHGQGLLNNKHLLIYSPFAEGSVNGVVNLTTSLIQRMFAVSENLRISVLHYGCAFSDLIDAGRESNVFVEQKFSDDSDEVSKQIINIHESRPIDHILMQDAFDSDVQPFLDFAFEYHIPANVWIHYTGSLSRITAHRLRHVKNIATVSQFMVDFLRYYPFMNAQLLDPFVDMGEWMAPGPIDARNLYNDDPYSDYRILMVGPIGRRKNQWQALGWLSEIVKRVPHKKLKLTLIAPNSEGTEIERFAQKAAEKNVSANIIGHGISSQELRHWYAFSDLVLMPSSHEALGKVSIEAQMTGIPVVVSREGGLPETVDHREELIVDLHKNKEAIDKIFALLMFEHSRKLLAKEGQKYVQERYGRDNFANIVNWIFNASSSPVELKESSGSSDKNINTVINNLSPMKRRILIAIYQGHQNQAEIIKALNGRRQSISAMISKLLKRDSLIVRLKKNYYVLLPEIEKWFAQQKEKDIQQLWEKKGKREQKAGPKISFEQSQALIERLTPRVRTMALSIKKGLSGDYDVSILVSAGMFGLWDAANKFDPAKDIKFETYVEYRIRGEIISAVQEMDHLPKKMRRRQKELENGKQATEHALNGRGEEEDYAKEMGLTLEEYRALEEKSNNGKMLSLERINRQLPSSESSAFDRLFGKEKKTIMHEAISVLAPKQRQVMRMIYSQGYTVKKVASILGCLETNIRNLRIAAILRLKQYVIEIEERSRIVMLLGSSGRESQNLEILKLLIKEQVESSDPDSKKHEDFVFRPQLRNNKGYIEVSIRNNRVQAPRKHNKAYISTGVKGLGEILIAREWNEKLGYHVFTTIGETKGSMRRHRIKRKQKGKLDVSGCVFEIFDLEKALREKKSSSPVEKELLLVRISVKKKKNPASISGIEIRAGPGSGKTSSPLENPQNIPDLHFPSKVGTGTTYSYFNVIVGTLPQTNPGGWFVGGMKGVQTNPRGWFVGGMKGVPEDFNDQKRGAVPIFGLYIEGVPNDFNNRLQLFYLPPAGIYQFRRGLAKITMKENQRNTTVAGIPGFLDGFGGWQVVRAVYYRAAYYLTGPLQGLRVPVAVSWSDTQAVSSSPLDSDEKRKNLGTALKLMRDLGSSPVEDDGIFDKFENWYTWNFAQKVSPEIKELKSYILGFPRDIHFKETFFGEITKVFETIPAFNKGPVVLHQTYASTLEKIMEEKRILPRFVRGGRRFWYSLSDFCHERGIFNLWPRADWANRATAGECKLWNNTGVHGKGFLYDMGFVAFPMFVLEQYSSFREKQGIFLKEMEDTGYRFDSKGIITENPEYIDLVDAVYFDLSITSNKDIRTIEEAVLSRKKYIFGEERTVAIMAIWAQKMIKASGLELGSSSPVNVKSPENINLVFVSWDVHVVPGGPEILTGIGVETSISPVEEGCCVSKKVLYLLWSSRSIFDRLWGLLKEFFGSLFMKISGIFKRTIVTREIKPLASIRIVPAGGTALGIHQKSVSVAPSPVKTNTVGAVINRGRVQMHPSPVENSIGAVVASSAVVVDPTKGDPNDPVWRNFYEKKLDPLTPRHEVYFPQFVQNFMNPDRADWQTFRKVVESDPDSPWQVVLAEVAKKETKRKSVEIAKPVIQPKTEEKTNVRVETTKPTWQGIAPVPVVIHEWKGRNEVPVGIKSSEENVSQDTIKDLNAYLGSFMDFVWEFLADILMKLHSMRQRLALVMTDIGEMFFPTWFVPGLAFEFVMKGTVPERGLSPELVSSPVNSRAAVVASSAVVVDPTKGDPNDPVWRNFYEKKLDPLTPRHEVYFPQFVQNFMDSSRADWQEFRKAVESDPNSPWQTVLVKVKELEAKNVIVKTKEKRGTAPLFSPEIQNTKKEKRIQKRGAVPNFSRRLKNVVRGISSYSGKVVLDVVHETLMIGERVMDATYAMGEATVRASFPMMVPVWATTKYFQPTYPTENNEEEAQKMLAKIKQRVTDTEQTRRERWKKTTGMVQASVSSMDDQSLSNFVWLRYFEDKPERARKLVEQAIEKGNPHAFDLLRENRGEYPNLNRFVDKMLGIDGPSVGNGKAVVASVSTMDLKSLNDSVWLEFFERTPEKARGLIVQAVKNDDFNALLSIRSDPDQYPQLNALVDEIE